MHIVIERRLPVELIKWLLRAGADPHIEDAEGYDCCDRAKQLDMYQNVNKLWKNECVMKPHLRKKFFANGINDAINSHSSVSMKLFKYQDKKASRMIKRTAPEDAELKVKKNI